MKTLAKAPSNIALIKYMGKKDSEKNLPSNGSLSMTLESLCSYVEVKRVEQGQGEVIWTGESPLEDFRCPVLDEKAILRVKNHVQKVFAEVPSDLDFKEFDWEIRSANTFPSGAGIASSASSFAALTLAVSAHLDSNCETVSSLSREGSGSSCRSFEGPFVKWEDETISKVESKMDPASDLVMIVSSKQKKVSSSEAHKRVVASPLWEGQKLLELRRD